MRDSTNESKSQQISFSQELARKAIHLSMLIVPFLVLSLTAKPVLYVMLPLAVAALLADFIRNKHDGFNSFIQTFFGKMLRSHESDGSFSINGATWVLCSFSLILLIFPPEIAAASIGIFVLGDAFAAIVGRRFGKHKLPFGNKSIEGSFAFLVFGGLIVPFIPALHWTSLLIGLVAGMLVEIPDRPFNDNLRVPLVVATVILIIERLI